MKTLSVLISLAAATAVNAAEETATSGSIRASRSSARGDVNVQYPVEKKKEKRVLNDKQRKMHKDAYDRHLTKKTGKSDAVPKEENNQERELSGGNYKAKSGFSKLMWQDDGYRAGGRIFGRNDDKPGWFDDDDGRWGGNMRDDDRGAKPGRSKDWGWMGGGSGKSGKSGGRYPSQDNWMGGGSGKSGKSGSPEYWGGSGKSGKSGGSGGGHNGLCQVTVTNLSFRQAFSKMFVMLHDQYVTNYFPLYEFGQSPTTEMCDLTQNLNGNGLQSFYNGRPGVQRAWVTTDFFDFNGDELSEASKYLDGGATFKFLIRPQVDYLSIAAGFPFANDGGIVLQAAPIFNGAEYYLPAVDSGCEANLQTCWSVPATQEDFQNLAPRAMCADDDISDTNNNDIGGENFVSIHRGMQDLDSKDEVEQLALLECDDASGVGEDDDQRFAKYFRVEGYDDDMLLCATVGSNGLCGLRSDDDFLDFVKSNDDVAGDDDVLIRIARDSDDFDDFCDRISDINKDLESAFKVLEPIIFDFRNPIARVSIEC